VRVLAFDVRNWIAATGLPNYNNIVDPRPILASKLFHAYDNPRAIAQQSVSIFSNLDDIEWLISFFEQSKQQTFLVRLDLVARDRNKAMRELQLMGITAESLLPGYDGICASLRERNF